MNFKLKKIKKDIVDDLIKVTSQFGALLLYFKPMSYIIKHGLRVKQILLGNINNTHFHPKSAL